VDVINGAVVEAGHRHSISVPTHEFVVELVHAMEGRA
jgi:2-dehydropantoate 2-reductase